MTRIIDTRGDYHRAYSWYLTAQGECPHWDYDNPEGDGYQCCLDMREAQQTVQRVRKRLLAHAVDL